jgi:hypothetical protein
VALFLIVASATSLLALSTMPDKPQTASVSLGVEFASGKYGADAATRSVYMPLIATWSPTDRFDIGIEIPFVYQSSSGVTTGLFRNSQQGMAAATAVAKNGPGGSGGAFLHQGAGGAGGAAAGSATTDVAGVGDIILRLGVITLLEGTKIPQIRSSLFLKFPTANTADGLGTGEFDIGAGIEMTKWFGDVHLAGEGLYTYQGKAEGFGLKNYCSYTAAVGYQLTENLEPMVVVKGATAPSDYSGELLEVRARFIWALNGATALDLYGSRGIAASSPEYGAGIAVVYSY